MQSIYYHDSARLLVRPAPGQGRAAGEEEGEIMGNALCIDCKFFRYWPRGENFTCEYPKNRSKVGMIIHALESMNKDGNCSWYNKA